MNINCEDTNSCPVFQESNEVTEVQKDFVGFFTVPLIAFGMIAWFKTGWYIFMLLYKDYSGGTVVTVESTDASTSSTEAGV